VSTVTEGPLGTGLASAGVWVAGGCVGADGSGVAVSDVTTTGVGVGVGVGGGGIGVFVGAKTTGVGSGADVKVGSGVRVGCAERARLLKTTLNSEAKTI
jgi:hypothetical protein